MCSWWQGDGKEVLELGLKGGDVEIFPCFWMSANPSMSWARAMTCSTGIPGVPSGV